MFAQKNPAFAQENLGALLEKNAPSIVTVKVVLKIEINMGGQAQAEEERSELQGVVVDPTGLVMISNAEISADRMKEAMSDNPMMGQLDIKMTPNDFKVMFGNEEKEYAAFLVATDTKLDLAFIQVQDLGDMKPHVVNFADAPKPAVGDKIVSVSRMQKGYDYAPYFSSGHVSGAIKKPRTAWIVDGNVGAYGLPVFNTAGKAVGVLITLPATTSDDSGGGFGSMLRMMRGGGAAGPLGSFVLPAKSVNRLVTQSIAKSKELQAESEADEAKEESSDGDK